MSDKYEQLKKNLKHLSSTYSPGILVSTLDGTRMAITDLQEENVSLITTIESQKEEIEKLTRKNLNAVDYAVRGLLDEADSTAEIESLKAITELAKNGLREVHTITMGVNPTRGFLMQNIVNIAEKVEDTLSEITRLQNA